METLLIGETRKKNNIQDECRLLRRDEVARAARTLAESFGEYALTRYLFPDSKMRAIQLQAFMQAYVEIILDIGRVYTVKDPSLGVALFLPPEVRDIPMLKMIPQMLKYSRYTGLSYLPRLNVVTQEFESKRPKSPHWYLTLIGVSPMAQGLGISKKLTQNAYALADQKGQDVYLETNCIANVEIYQRHGYKLIEHFFTKRGNGIETWTMLRRARSSLSHLSQAS